MTQQHLHPGHPPHLMSVWRYDRISFAWMLCLVPALAVTLLFDGPSRVLFLAACFVTVLFWQGLFALVRKRGLGWDVLVTPMIFVLIADGGLPLWQTMLALSFGVVVGEQIFGGRGYSFLNPVVTSLAFLTFAFPGNGFAEPAPMLAWASLPGCVFLVWIRFISWRLLLAQIIALAAIAVISGAELAPADLMTGGFLFTLVFLACDPASSATTNLGRWINGLLIGGLCWVFSPAEGLDLGAKVLIPAILLASIFAPLADICAVKINGYERRRRGKS